MLRQHTPPTLFTTAHSDIQCGPREGGACQRVEVWGRPTGNLVLKVISSAVSDVLYRTIFLAVPCLPLKVQHSRPHQPGLRSVPPSPL